MVLRYEENFNFLISMINLNNTIYDYKQYSIYGDKHHPEFIISDIDSLQRLVAYADFEKTIINQIKNKQKAIYLRFCDWEYLYYRKWFHFLPWIQKILWRDSTCRWEKPNYSLVKKHFDIFEKHKDYLYLCPHVSDSWIKNYKTSKLYEYIQNKNRQINHFYYIYHFLNKLRQNKIENLKDIKIWYITHNKYIAWLDHFTITASYSTESINYLTKQDFSHYDLLLLGWWTASPLYADAIATSAHCPIVDAGYMLSIRNADSTGARVFTWLYV
jgi:hypothetical protein